MEHLTNFIKFNLLLTTFCLCVKLRSVFKGCEGDLVVFMKGEREHLSWAASRCAGNINEFRRWS